MTSSTPKLIRWRAAVRKLYEHNIVFCLYLQNISINTYNATKSSPIIYMFRVLIFVCLCVFVCWSSPLLILFKPRAQWNFWSKWICPSKQVYQKFGIKKPSKQFAPLIFQAKTIEITHIANWSKCRTANMIATWLDRSLVRARIHWGLHTLTTQ